MIYTKKIADNSAIYFPYSEPLITLKMYIGGLDIHRNIQFYFIAFQSKIFVSVKALLPEGSKLEMLFWTKFTMQVIGNKYLKSCWWNILVFAACIHKIKHC